MLLGMEISLHNKRVFYLLLLSWNKRRCCQNANKNKTSEITVQRPTLIYRESYSQTFIFDQMDRLDQNMYGLDYHYSNDDKYDVNNTDLISIKYFAVPFAPSSNLSFFVIRLFTYMNCSVIDLSFYCQPVNDKLCTPSREVWQEAERLISPLYICSSHTGLSPVTRKNDNNPEPCHKWNPGTTTERHGAVFFMFTTVIRLHVLTRLALGL